jgi:hypothetical protein
MGLDVEGSSSIQRPRTEGRLSIRVGWAIASSGSAFQGIDFHSKLDLEER